MTAYLPPFIALLVAAGVFLGYIHPTYTGEIATLKSDIENYDRALAAARNYLGKQNEIAEKRQTLTDQDVERLKGFLPDGVDNVQLILDLNTLASRSGLSISDIDVQGTGQPASVRGGVTADMSGDRSATPSGASPTESIDLSLRVSGTYGALFAFLTAMENSLRPLDVTALSVQETPGSPLYAITMTVRTYWLR